MKGNLGAVQAVPTTVFVDKEGKQVGVLSSGKSSTPWQLVRNNIPANAKTDMPVIHLPFLIKSVLLYIPCFLHISLKQLNIWGTFCGPCIAEMPELGELSREYEGSGVRIIGMLCDVYEPGDEEALEIIDFCHHLICLASYKPPKDKQDG